MMKRMILLLLAGMLMMSPAFAEEDDSTPYMPYPENTQTPQPAPAKKAAPKKKTPAKKTPAKKTQPKKAAPKPTARPSSLQQGIALMQAEKYEQAKPYLLKAIQENRNDPNAWYWYGVYHEKTGGFHQAQYFYSKAVTLDPAFEPLSRVVYYPEDSEKTPLWDPKRPARVYPVEVASTGGVSGVPAGLPGRSSFPEAPNDPELPHVPVYTPPEPGSSPFDGDAWNPAVYVPPSPEEVNTEGGITPQYLPPAPESIVAQTTRPTLEVPLRYPEGTEIPQTPAQENRVVRADKPVYNPPDPGGKAPVPPKQPQTVKKQTAQAKTPAKTQGKTPQVSSQRTASVPNNRVVRQTQKKTAAKKTTQAKTPASTPAPQRRQTASRDVRPQTPAQSARPAQPAQPQPKTPEPVTLPPEPENTPQQRQQENQYIPPVGQQTPDPGTVPENPIPPVGQGNQY